MRLSEANVRFKSHVVVNVVVDEALLISQNCQGGGAEHVFTVPKKDIQSDWPMKLFSVKSVERIEIQFIYHSI